MENSKQKKLRTVGCFMELHGKFLILQRSPNKPDGNTWGLPAGKVHNGESDEEAMLREIKEETGYEAAPKELELLGIYTWEFPDLHLEFPTYRIRLQKPINVKHRSDEHLNFKWVTAKECYAMPDLIRGFHELLKLTGYIR